MLLDIWLNVLLHKGLFCPSHEEKVTRQWPPRRDGTEPSRCGREPSEKSQGESDFLQPLLQVWCRWMQKHMAFARFPPLAKIQMKLIFQIRCELVTDMEVIAPRPQKPRTQWRLTCLTCLRFDDLKRVWLWVVVARWLLFHDDRQLKPSVEGYVGWEGLSR